MAKVTRLYKNFKPSRYELFIEPNKDSLSFEGKVKITGKLEVKDGLYLHCKDLKIVKILVNSRDTKFKFDKSKDLLKIETFELENIDLKLEISFEGKITSQMHGLYPCKGRDQAITLATQFESHHAREVFPCIDEPEAKAIFSLAIKTAKNDTVLSNTNIINEEVVGPFKICQFEDTPLMSTYLLAFVIGQLEYQEASTVDGVSVKSWATPDQVDFTTFALDIAVKSLEFFNNYFGVAYPLNKCDIVALPDFAAGAMENWGLLTFRETCMLVDPKNTSLDNQQYVAMVVAHEVAHQWFGNLVTMRWWNDLWLNEGFASWIEYKAVDNIYPSWHMWTHFIANEQQTAFRLDALKNTHPIEVDVPDPELIPSIFDGISYSKGACMIHMLNEYLGDDLFRQGLSHYLTKYAYQNTVTNDLWEALSETSGLPVADFMSNWTSQPGFPYISLHPTKNELELSQKRFLSSGADIVSKEWPIPLLSTDIKTEILNTKNTCIDHSADGEVLLNSNQAGFYITKYWPEAYDYITKKLRNNSLDETKRIGLLADMLALTKAGHLPATQLLDTLKAYDKETSAPVWDIIATTLGDLRHILGNDVRQALKPFVRNLVDEQLTRLSWDESDKDSHFDKLLRPLILGLASGADTKEVIEVAKQKFDKAEDITDIASNLRNMIIASVSHNGGEVEFNKLLGMLKKSKSPEDKLVLAHGLTNFRNKAQYNKSIEIFKSDLVKLQDIHYWIIYGLNNPEFRQTVWHWIKQNWTWLKENFANDMSYPRLPVYIARSFNNKNSLEDYNQFFESVYENCLDRGIKQGKEIICANIAWRKRDEKAVIEWLKQAI